MRLGTKVAIYFSITRKRKLEQNFSGAKTLSINNPQTRVTQVIPATRQWL